MSLLLVIAYLGFVSLGLPDTVAGVAWPSLREQFALPQSAFGLVFIALGCGYCLSGFFGGKLTQFLGLGNLLWLSSGFVAIAMFGSGFAPVWPVFVVCGVVWGLGSGGIDAGLNAYASRHFSAKHVNWLHACYSVGATLGPLLMTAMLVQLGSWRLGYHLVGGVLFIMTLLFLFTHSRWNDPTPTTETAVPVGMIAVLKNRLVWFHIVLYFLYVGIEFTIGQWCFTLLTESRGVSPHEAGVWASVYYGTIGVGRVLAGMIAARVGLDRLLRLAMLTAVAGAVVFALGFSFGLAVVGLGLAPVFPCLMARTPQRLGEAVATHAVGFQVTAGMIGAALIPGAAGIVGQQYGLEFVGYFAVLLAFLMFGMHEWLLTIARPRS